MRKETQMILAGLKSTSIADIAAMPDGPFRVGPKIDRWATVSPCERYRYLLGRSWGPGPRVLWVMLNPSTADARLDDPTIRKCLEFSRRLGFGSLEVVNLYAWRSTDPAGLKTAPDPIGPDNARHLADAAERCDRIIVAWGANASPDPGAVSASLGDRPLWCLGRTKDGQPRHPLMLAYATPLEIWRLAHAL